MYSNQSYIQIQAFFIILYGIQLEASKIQSLKRPTAYYIAYWRSLALK